MIVEFDKSFVKWLAKIRDKSVLLRIENVILTIENSETISKLKGVEKISGFKKYFRIRSGDYRIGFEKISGNKIVLIIVAHRSEIYKIFP